ncbi:MAG TPA: succinate-semialdehyde dehydrogenase (NADP(+)), partial [Rhizobiales bacterium]|nr:succinate-semialdehyde dehydrogenase (NADP(+)) [Hyphomicrobiales bacterium]
AALVDAVKKLAVGPGIEAGTNIGPLINSEAVAKVETLVGDAVKKGAKVLIGGARDAAG